jgi:hypothetical protein
MQSTNNSSSNSRQQFLREILETAKQRIMSRNNATNERNETAEDISNLFTPFHSINANLMEMIVGVGYILILILFLIKILVRTIHKFEYYYMSPSYNRFGFFANEESDYDDDSKYESESQSDSDNGVTSLSSSPSPTSLRKSLSSSSLSSSGGKYLHIQTPVQNINIVTPQTPLPLRRSLRLKIKSELNLSEMENKAATQNTVMTRSQTKQNQRMTKIKTISSDPCPIIPYHSSITSPSPHPEHDEERAFYIRYCNEKKMRSKRPEFNSPLFVRRLML